MLPAAIKDLLQSAGQAKEQSDITITRGCNHQRLSSLRWRGTQEWKKKFCRQTLNFVPLPQGNMVVILLTYYSLVILLQHI
jgi:hypothetical protein